jgi:bacterioferritin
MGGTSDLIHGLNEQLNREVSTALRYMVQAARIRGVHWEPAREMYLSEVTDEIGHAQYLANTIVALGGSPSLDPDLSPPPPDVEAMLKADIEQEWEDVKHYTRLADLADAEGCMAVKLQMEEQAADEENHGRQMERMLGG